MPAPPYGYLRTAVDSEGITRYGIADAAGAHKFLELAPGHGAHIQLREHAGRCQRSLIYAGTREINSVKGHDLLPVLNREDYTGYCFPAAAFAAGSFAAFSVYHISTLHHLPILRWDFTLLLSH